MPAVIKYITKWFPFGIHKLIITVSIAIIALGIAPIAYALPMHVKAGSLWCVGSGMAIIFSGLLNLIAIERGGSRFSKAIAVFVNAANCLLFGAASMVIRGPLVYFGILIFFIATIAFFIEVKKQSF